MSSVLEQEIQQLVLLEASKTGNTLWRNNSGALKDATGRVVRYGLGNDSSKINEVFKSSDLIGITPRVITQDMVGSIIGVFTAIEMKRPDWVMSNTDREIAQKKFIDFVIGRGGIGGFCNSVDSYRKIIGL